MDRGGQGARGDDLLDGEQISVKPVELALLLLAPRRHPRVQIRELDVFHRGRLKAPVAPLRPHGERVRLRVFERELDPAAGCFVFPNDFKRRSFSCPSLRLKVSYPRGLRHHPQDKSVQNSRQHKPRLLLPPPARGLVHVPHFVSGTEQGDEYGLGDVDHDVVWNAGFVRQPDDRVRAQDDDPALHQRLVQLVRELLRELEHVAL